MSVGHEPSNSSDAAGSGLGEIVLGKWLACVGLLALMLVGTMQFWGLMHLWTRALIDLPVLTAYLWSLLWGIALHVAIGGLLLGHHGEPAYRGLTFHHHPACLHAHPGRPQELASWQDVFP